MSDDETCSDSDTMQVHPRPVPGGLTTSDVSVYLDSNILAPVPSTAEPPCLADGIYRTLPEDNSIEYIYFVPTVMSRGRQTNLKDKLPIAIVSNVNGVPTQKAVCLRSYVEFCQFSRHVHHNYPDMWIKPGNELFWCGHLLPYFSTERKHRAMVNFLKAATSDERLLSVPEFYRFIYSEDDLDNIFGVNHLVDQEQRLLRNRSSKEENIMNDPKWEEIANPMNDGPVYDLVNDDVPPEIWEDVEGEDVADQAVADQVVPEASSSAPQEAKSECSTSVLSSDHEMHIASSFLTTGNEERVAIARDGSVRVYDPNPIEVGSCPNQCHMKAHMPKGVSSSSDLRRSVTSALIHQHRANDSDGVAQSCPSEAKGFFIGPAGSSTTGGTDSNRSNDMEDIIETSQEEEMAAMQALREEEDD